MPRDVKPREIALGGAADVRLRRHAARAEFPQVDAVVILDVLHYIERAEQDAVLARVRGALQRGGVLLLRVGDASARRRFALSQWVDRDRRRRARPRGFIAARPAGRPSSGSRTLRGLGFDVERACR